MKLVQIPYSHNCVKVRRALELKGLGHELVNVLPTDREPVQRISGQRQVPVLVDGDRVVTDSTAILFHLEANYPRPSLLPDDPERHADCWLLEDWCDQAFMSLTRRLAYWQIVNSKRTLGALFYPQHRGLGRALRTAIATRVVKRRFRLSARQNRHDEREIVRVARLALARLGNARFLYGDRVTVADLTLATMSAPAWRAPAVRDLPEVRALLDWGLELIGDETARLYRI